MTIPNNIHVSTISFNTSNYNTRYLRNFFEKIFNSYIATTMQIFHISHSLSTTQLDLLNNPNKLYPLFSLSKAYQYLACKLTFTTTTTLLGNLKLTVLIQTILHDNTVTIYLYPPLQLTFHTLLFMQNNYYKLKQT